MHTCLWHVDRNALDTGLASACSLCLQCYRVSCGAQALQAQLAEVRSAGQAAATNLAQTAAALAERQAALQQAGEQRSALEAQVCGQVGGCPGHAPVAHGPKPRHPYYAGASAWHRRLWLTRPPSCSFWQGVSKAPTFVY